MITLRDSYKHIYIYSICTWKLSNMINEFNWLDRYERMRLFLKMRHTNIIVMQVVVSEFFIIAVSNAYVTSIKRQFSCIPPPTMHSFLAECTAWLKRFDFSKPPLPSRSYPPCPSNPSPASTYSTLNLRGWKAIVIHYIILHMASTVPSKKLLNSWKWNIPVTLSDRPFVGWLVSRSVGWFFSSWFS